MSRQTLVCHQQVYTKDCIIFFSHGRNGLEELQLSEAGLKALGQCGTLGAVNAGQAHGVTDAVVSALCEGNLSLKSLV